MPEPQVPHFNSPDSNLFVWFCCKLSGLAELLIVDGNAGLCGEDGELPGEGRIWIEGESRLSFAHHVNHFDAG
jgi:hypothetical protein